MYKILIFEGIDCSGKSTIKSAFEKKTKFKHLCVDRMFVTSIVYNRVFERNRKDENILTLDMLKFVRTFDPIFVYVNTPKEDIMQRIVNRGDDMVKNMDILESLDDEYRAMFFFLKSCFPRNVIEIDGSQKVDHSVNNILQFIKPQRRK